MPARNNGDKAVGLGDRKTADRQGCRSVVLVLVVRVRFSTADIFRYFVRQRAPAGQTTGQRVHESIVTLSPFGLRGGLGAIRQGRRGGQPEPHEQGQCLIGDVAMALQPLDLSRQSIEPARKRSFEPIGAVRRQMRCQRSFHYKRLRNPLSGCVVCQLASEVRR